jgi:segregation and condensation protein A
VKHEVRLDVFEGPIDLLLHLITRKKVDIYEVSLATITDEYLRAVARMDRIDLESATGFLVVAATLVELKSARLLPAHSPDDVDSALLEERDLLLARLVECATYREAGSWLRARLAEGELHFGRTAELEPAFMDLVPDLLHNLTPERLSSVAAASLAPAPVPELDISHLEPIRASVRDAIGDIANVLSTNGTASFRWLCSGVERIGVVVRFLALLELFKAGAVEVNQAECFGDIVVYWTGETTLGDALLEVDEYGLEVDARAGTAL